MRRLPLALAGLLAGWPPAGATAAPALLSPDRAVALEQRRTPEKPTLFLFFRPGSVMERDLAAALEKEFAGLAGLRWVHLKTGSETLAKQHQIADTPTALIYDRRGRLVARAADPEAIRAAVRKALGVPRIDWAADDDPRMAQVEQLIGRRPAGGIMRTMSLQPEHMAAIHQLARKAHFAPGYLDVRTKEMIATHVSALNRCKF